MAENDWTHVLFTYESRYCLRSPDGRESLWCVTGERYAECTFNPRVNFPGGLVVGWTGIYFTELSVLKGTQILVAYVVRYAELVGGDFLLMQL